MDLLSETRQIDTASVNDYFYYHTGTAVIDHLFRVAAGLDSLVLGEPQILGQVTEGYMTAVAAHTTGPSLTTLFKAAIRTGKRARTETAVSANSCQHQFGCHRPGPERGGEFEAETGFGDWPGGDGSAGD